MALIQVNLTHTNTKPQETIISINGEDLIAVRTHSSKLRFLKPKINRSSGKANSGEYFFETEDEL